MFKRVLLKLAGNLRQFSRKSFTCKESKGLNVKLCHHGINWIPSSVIYCMRTNFILKDSQRNICYTSTGYIDKKPEIIIEPTKKTGHSTKKKKSIR